MQQSPEEALHQTACFGDDVATNLRKGVALNQPLLSVRCRPGTFSKRMAWSGQRAGMIHRALVVSKIGSD